MPLEDNYEKKFLLLAQKYADIETSNEKLKNRVYNIRKQIRYLRKLKRILIQKLVGYGDRFMDVCLEIPDMEPGANVEDQIIHRVAEVPAPAVIAPSASRTSVTGAEPPAAGAKSMAPPKKRRKTLPSTGSIGGEPAKIGAKKQSVSSVTNVQSNHSRGESVDAQTSRSIPTSTITTSSLVNSHVAASVEDVVNSIIFECQQKQRQAEEEKPRPAAPTAVKVENGTSSAEIFITESLVNEHQLAMSDTPTVTVVLQEHQHIAENASVSVSLQNQS